MTLLIYFNKIMCYNLFIKNKERKKSHIYIMWNIRKISKNMRKVIDIKKIKKREISEKEIKKNEKESKKYKLLMYTIPIIILIILVILYIITVNHFILIPFGIIFFLFLFGWDSQQRICPKCKKWNSLIWIENKIILRTTKTKKKILKKEYEKNKKEKVSRSVGKCKNCGEEIKKI